MIYPFKIFRSLSYFSLISFCISCTGCAENPIPGDSIEVKLSDKELLDSVQYYTFQYFWDGAEPNSGMAPERIHIDGNYPDNDISLPLVVLEWV